MPRTSQRTKPGTRKLSDVAKHLVVPTGITATGWPAVEHTCKVKLGLEFDDWQQHVGKVILAKRADGKLAAMIDGVGLSVCRQVGKTYTVGALVFALCVNTPGLLVIWSAHHSRTHAETFLAMQEFAQRAKIAPHVKFVHTGSNTEEIAFHNGSRILFGARERGFGRGIPGVDVLIFDEAQILSDRALSNMLATLNTSSLGLQLYIGTPPKPEDMSEAFTRMRTQALKGELTDGAWIEIGAADDADSADRAQWVKNPSYPYRTPAESMLRLKRKLTDADWRREGLGIWDKVGTTNGALPYTGWLACADKKSKVPKDGHLVFGFDVSWNRDRAYVGLAGLRKDGLTHAQLIHACDPSDVVTFLVERAKTFNPAAICVQGLSGPASSLIEDLRKALDDAGSSVPVVELGGSDMARARGFMYDAIKSKSIRHLDQPEVNEALKVAVGRNVGDGVALDRKKSVGDIAGIVAITNAVYQLSLTEPPGDPGVWVI